MRPGTTATLLSRCAEGRVGLVFLSFALVDRSLTQVITKVAKLLGEGDAQATVEAVNPELHTPPTAALEEL